jgi:hypothetical protein
MDRMGVSGTLDIGSIPIRATFKTYETLARLRKQGFFVFNRVIIE